SMPHHLAFLYVFTDALPFTLLMKARPRRKIIGDPNTQSPWPGVAPDHGSAQRGRYSLVGARAPPPRSTACHTREPYRFTADPQHVRRMSGATTGQGLLVQRIAHCKQIFPQLI